MKAGYFVGMNKSTGYFSLAFIHVVRMFVVALSLHLSRGRRLSVPACALSDDAVPFTSLRTVCVPVVAVPFKAYVYPTCLYVHFCVQQKGRNISLLYRNAS